MTPIPTPIPPAALWLGLAGLLPFLWGAATVLAPGLAVWTGDLVGPRFAGTQLLQSYGIVILAFMSGVIWGFATRASGAEAVRGYAISVLPALWAFFFGTGAAVPSLFALAAGFAALLLMDARYFRLNLAPPWWMRLRLLLTSIVVICLLIGAVG